MRARVAGAVVVACASAIAVARAQRVEAPRPRTIVVGAPRGASPADRVDRGRTGASRSPLPTGTLHVAWRRNLALPIDAPPLVDARGDVTVLTARGDLITLAADGEERAHVGVGSAATSPAALLSDGTAVFATAASDVVGVRLGGARFRTRIGGGRAAAGPLALDDGGFVIATSAELVALDGEGGIRARASLEAGDPPVSLLAAPGEDAPTVYAVRASGGVTAWVPASGREATRAGAFGGPTDGGAALAPASGTSGGAGSLGELIAVVGSQVVALDLARGTVTPRAAAATSGAVLFLGPPAVERGRISILLVNPTRTTALTIDAVDAAGSEVLRQAVAPSLLAHAGDAGPGAGQIPPHLGPLVDPQGDVAFALPSGELGVVSPSGTVDSVADVCAHSGPVSPLANLALRAGPVYAGLAPGGPHALIVACGSGSVVRVDSDLAAPPR